MKAAIAHGYLTMHAWVPISLRKALLVPPVRRSDPAAGRTAARHAERRSRLYHEAVEGRTKAARMADRRPHPEGAKARIGSMTGG
jgi:hypothetical protein